MQCLIQLPSLTGLLCSCAGFDESTTWTNFSEGCGNNIQPRFLQCILLQRSAREVAGGKSSLGIYCPAI